MNRTAIFPANTFYFLAILLFLIACAKDRKTNVRALTRPGISRDLAVYRASNVSDVHYKLHFRIRPVRDTPVREEKITSEAEVIVSLSEISGPLILDFQTDAGRDSLRDLTVNGKKAEPVIRSGHLIIPKALLHTGENRIRLSYDAAEQSIIRNEGFLYTLLVPDRASRLFPCFDQPDIKARFSLKLTVPESWSTVANGRLEASAVEGLYKTVSYSTTRPIPTYLFAFAAGELKKLEQTIDGRQLVMYYRETDTAKVNRNRMKIFGLHAKAYKWMEEYTGIPFPFEDYEFFVIPGFAYGGMEHPGAIWYNASRMFLEENPTRDQELQRASVIAHEVSHIWFGDLVTMKWFDDVWLKEVYANFLADKITQSDFEDVDRKLKFVYEHYPAAYRIDRTLGTHPILQELDNLQDAGSLYGSIIYHKAPIVMKHLENMTGEAKMQEGLRVYLNRYKNGNASWDDLIGILSKTSGRDLSRWNRDWIRSSGIPHIRIEAKDTVRGQWVLRQMGKDVKEQNLTVEFIYKDTISTYPVHVQSAETVLTTGNNHTPEYINVFGSNYEYGYYELSPSHLNWLLKNIHSEKEDTRRLVYWLTLWENFVNAKIDPDKLMAALITAMGKEQNPFILQYVLATGSDVYWRFCYGRDHDRINGELEDQLWHRLVKEENAKIKRMLWESYIMLASRPADQDRVYRVWQKKDSIPGLELSEDDYTDLAVSLCLNKHPEWKTIMAQQPLNIKDPDNRNKFLFLTSALSNDTAERTSFFDKLKVLENRRKEAWVQTGIKYLHHPSRVQDSRKYLGQTLELLKVLKETGDIFFPANVLYYSFNYHTTHEAIRIVEHFLDRHTNYPPKLKNQIYQATDMMKRSNVIKKKFNIES